MSALKSMRLWAWLTPLLAVAAAAGAASASCAPPPSGVDRIDGVVREAAGGDTVCIQAGSDDLHLIRVRLLDVAAAPLRSPGGEGAKWALRRAARGRPVVCTVGEGGAGLCRIGGVAIGDILRAKAR